MKLLNQLNLNGEIHIRHYDRFHNVIADITQANLITNAGRIFFAKKILDISDTVILDKIGIGEGSDAATLEDITLDSAGPYGTGNYAYASIRFKQIVDGNDANKGIYVEALFPDGVYSDNTVSEVGLYTSNTDSYTGEPELVARSVLSGANQFDKAATDYLSVAWKITLG